MLIMLPSFSGGTDMVLASESTRIPRQIMEVVGGTNFFLLMGQTYLRKKFLQKIIGLMYF